MSVFAVVGSAYRDALVRGKVDFSSDTFKIMLMKSGYVFDTNVVKYLKNVHGIFNGSGSVTDIAFSATNNSITTTAGDFVAAGLIAGNTITISNTTNNNFTVTISTVTTTTITVVETGTLVDETGTTAKIEANDELASANGYTQNSTPLGTATITDNSGSVDITFPTVSWTASGGDIGATPGAIVYDDTNADDVIVGYLDFGGEQTAANGSDFTIASLSVRVY